VPPVYRQTVRSVWDSAWLAHLYEVLYPDAYDTWMRAHVRPYADLIKRNVMLAVGAKQHTERDD
jgi:hypothetical protein